MANALRLDSLKLAVAGGVLGAVVLFLSTLMTLLNVPGFAPFTSILAEMYGPYGYSVSMLGALIGAVWGFVEGFWQVGLVALVYNWLLRM